MKEYIKTFYTTIIRHMKKKDNDLTLCETLNTFQIKCRYCVFNVTGFNICSKLEDIRKCLK